MSKQVSSENLDSTTTICTITRRRRSRRAVRTMGQVISSGVSQMGNAVSSQAEDLSPPKQDSSVLAKIPKLYQITSTMTSPGKADLSNVCPVCCSLLSPILDPSGQAKPLLQCPKCPVPLCQLCLYPCPSDACTNQSCCIVSVLLTCDRVTDRASRVFGCPQFRACPKCHNIMMHTGGCKYVTCNKCKHRYCYICLRRRKECASNNAYYFLPTCSVPTAARQRFYTTELSLSCTTEVRVT